MSMGCVKASGGQPDRKPVSVVGTICRLIAAGTLALASHVHAASDGESLRAGFESPPDAVRPTVWWRFMDDLMTREGLTADLDFMKQAGLRGGVVSFCSSRTKMSTPKPGLPVVPILSKDWWSLIGFQLGQASKRDLDLWFQACPGYATSGGPWISPALSMQKIVWSEVSCEGGKPFHAVLPVPAVDPKWNYYQDVAVLAVPTGAPGIPVSPDNVVDLGKMTDPSGRLKWSPPAGGAWKIFRFGHTTTGVPVHPVTTAGSGLECDKLSREATRFQFDSYFKKILLARPSGSRAKVALFYDSWEAGNQNWTPKFREEFQKRRGYDLQPWLPVAAGVLVGSEEQSRRFDCDWRTTVEEMISGEHFAELARLCQENGSREFRAQPYNGPVNFMTAGAHFDIPEGEFWHVNKAYGWWTLRMIASVSHVNGKPVASAESLTASPEDIRFDVDPFSTKAETDLAFTMGINEISIPHIPHNPWPRLKPGMNAGPYGMLLAPGQVWAGLAGSWITYLGRCCHLLRQGTFAADVVQVFRPGQKGYEPPAGFAGDICNEELIISSMTWDGQGLSLPGGMRYKVLELPDTTKVLAPFFSPTGIETRLNNKSRPQNISLPLLRKVRELVLAGATVAGPRPLTTPGLSGYPACDEEVDRIAAELWGPPAEGPVDRRVGKGRVLAGIPIADVLARMCIQPDFQTAEPLPAADVPWIHRSAGADDWYFVSNQKNEPLEITASFRVDGKIPEFWHADTGTSEPARTWSHKDGRTDVAIALAPRGSVFVRFRPGAPGESPAPVVQDPIPLSGDWKVNFSPAMGAPAEVVFPQLVSWTDRPEKGVRFYSGVATYRKEVAIPPDHLGPGRRILLDLGDVKNLARITVNGTAFPELWKPPFTCDITKAAKPGVNQIAIEVVNVWANRLIGDEQEAPDVSWGPEQFNPSKRYKGQALEVIPDWVRQGIPRPSQERRTFTTWNYVQKDQPLLSSGLLGPVAIHTTTN